MADPQSLYFLELSEKFKPTLDEVTSFIDDKVMTVEEEYFESDDKENRWRLSDRPIPLRRSILRRRCGRCSSCGVSSVMGRRNRMPSCGSIRPRNCF